MNPMILSLVLGLVIFAVIILVLIFWIFMLVDCAKRQFKKDTDKIAGKLCEEWESNNAQPLDSWLKEYSKEGLDFGDKFPPSCKSKIWKTMGNDYKDKIIYLFIATRFSTFEEFKDWLDKNQFPYSVQVFSDFPTKYKINLFNQKTK